MVGGFGTPNTSEFCFREAAPEGWKRATRTPGHLRGRAAGETGERGEAGDNEGEEPVAGARARGPRHRWNDGHRFMNQGGRTSAGARTPRSAGMMAWERQTHWERGRSPLSARLGAPRTALGSASSEHWSMAPGARGGPTRGARWPIGAVDDAQRFVSGEMRRSGKAQDRQARYGGIERIAGRGRRKRRAPWSKDGGATQLAPAGQNGWWWRDFTMGVGGANWVCERWGPVAASVIFRGRAG
jgi:hypothetical protein